MLAKLRQLLRDGEGLTVEFKRCEDKLVNDVFKTVSAFSNRYGGHIIFGVEDDGTVCGVNPKAAAGIKKNFASTLNNPERFSPTLWIALEEAVIDGKTVLWCFVPPGSQVSMFGGRIYDRAEDGDMDITRNSMMVSHIHQRKINDHTERKIFPYANNDDFEFARLMPKVRRLAIAHTPNHPWADMGDMEILRSAGLYQANDREIGKSGYNLAAILLFGREEVIRSCTAYYITDAICRRENLDRYDDRLMVTANLIDAYDQLMDFIAKHTLDRFFLIGDQSVSVRSKIAREIVSNILVHREYSSAFPAKIIIERDRIVTENWNLSQKPGPIDPHNFTPYPKNPILANFFVNIGRADVLGSGVRNLYRFTKIYSGGTPKLIEGDVFKTIVPLNPSNGHVTDVTDNVTDVTDNVTDVTDNVADVTDNVTDVTDNVTDVTDNVTDVIDNVTDVTDNVTDVTDSVTDITDNVTDVTDNVTDDTDNVIDVTDTVIDVTDNVTDSVTDDVTDSVTDDVTDVTDNVTDSVTDVTDRTFRILSLIAENNKISVPEIAKNLGVTKRTILRDIEKLKKERLLERVGSEKSGHWSII